MLRQFLIVFLILALGPSIKEVSAETQSPVIRLMGSEQTSSSLNKWCQIDGDEVRYSNLSQAPIGFETCGQVDTVSVCNNDGSRYFGAQAAERRDSLPCSAVKEAAKTVAVPAHPTTRTQHNPHRLGPMDPQQADFSTNSDPLQAYEDLLQQRQARSIAPDSLPSQPRPAQAKLDANSGSEMQLLNRLGSLFGGSGKEQSAQIQKPRKVAAPRRLDAQPSQGSREEALGQLDTLLGALDPASREQAEQAVGGYLNYLDTLRNFEQELFSDP